MDILDYIVMQIWTAARSILLSWLMLPAALLSSVATGGMLRFTELPFKGFLDRDLLPYSIAEEGALGTIHFLNTGDSDAILLESDGHFALVDAGFYYDDIDDSVVDYVKHVTGGHLDFIMGTHAHLDHLGGFVNLLEQPDIAVDRAYLKPDRNDEAYDDVGGVETNLYKWILEACGERGIELVQENLEHRIITLGNMELKIFNGNEEPSDPYENANSLCLLVECGGGRAFLAGDLNNLDQRETRIAGEVGKVDLLKAGHHGLEGSTTMGLLAQLRPRTVVFTNDPIALLTMNVKWRTAWIANSRMMATGSFEDGIAAVFGECGMQYYEIGK